MSAQDPYGSYFSINVPSDPTDPNSTQVPLQIPTIPGVGVGANPTQAQPPGQAPPNTALTQGLGVGATALGALLNYLATAQRNNLLQQQIASNNQLIQADQARRDYYSSILMPSMLGAMNITNPQTIQRAQGALNQSNFPGPLTASGTGLTSGAPATTTGTTGTTGATTPTLTTPPFRRPLPTGLLTNTPAAGTMTGGAGTQTGNYVPGIFSGADASMGPGTYPYQPTNPNGLPVI